MAEESAPGAPGAAQPAVRLVQPRWIGEFGEGSREWRRVFCEALGTFLLVIVACGGGVVDAISKGGIGRPAAVVAPALMVMAVILSVGTISGAHLNPVVSVAFALRREFPWLRIPAYIAAQVAGGLLACLVLWAMFGKVGALGTTVPGPGISGAQAMGIEAILTFGLVGTILGTASGAQNVGPLSALAVGGYIALAVGGYIALAGLWSSPISGASMNPVRSFAPAAVLGQLSHIWVYLAGPSLGALAAVGAAYVLRGPGADSTAARAAQGTMGTIVLAAPHVEADVEHAEPPVPGRHE